MNKIILNQSSFNELLSAAESERAVTYPNVAHWDSKSRMSVGKRATARSRAGLRALQLRKGINEDFIYVHPFETLKSWTFVDHFYLFVFKVIIVNLLSLVYAVLRENEQ
jgi:hypothetical protein